MWKFLFGQVKLPKMEYDEHQFDEKENPTWMCTACQMRGYEDEIPEVCPRCHNEKSVYKTEGDSRTFSFYKIIVLIIILLMVYSWITTVRR